MAAYTLSGLKLDPAPVGSNSKELTPSAAVETVVVKVTPACAVQVAKSE
jgi:hypothetical protein